MIDGLASVWPEWKVVELLGEGSYGKVYKVVRQDHGMTTFAAIKAISVPQSDSELAALRLEGLDAKGTRTYLQGIVADFTNEIKLMECFKGTSNIVSVEDYSVVERTDRVGWDIFIRMELLTSFADFTAERALSESDVIKLGRDICSGLELCAQQNIMHRDIKPQNIFVSRFGDFKVGDFGVARELARTSTFLSQSGTYNYMAPEVVSSGRYNATVDIYSLGLVLYQLLNNSRMPFVDPVSESVLYQDRQNAIARRMRGDVLPPPVNASPQLAQIVLIACAFDPETRFQSPTAFKRALEAVESGQLIPVVTPVDISATVVRPALQNPVAIGPNPEPRVSMATVVRGRDQLDATPLLPQAWQQTPWQSPATVAPATPIRIAPPYMGVNAVSASQGTPPSRWAKVWIPIVTALVAVASIAVAILIIRPGSSATNPLNPAGSPSTIASSAPPDVTSTSPIPSTVQTAEPPVTTTNTVSSSGPTSNVEEFTLYVNSRFGYHIEYPSAFILTNETADGSSATWTAPDGKATLTVSGRSNDEYATVASEYARLVPTSVPYHARGSNWFVGSWVDGNGNIVYLKEFVTATRVYCMEFVEPQSQKSQYDATITHLEKTFKTPS